MKGALPNGWNPRGAPLAAPGGTMMRLDGPDGRIGMAIWFRADLADHPMLQQGMSDVMPFVQDPGIDEVLPLIDHNRGQALYIYEIGEGRLLAEVLEECQQGGVVPGERVAIETMARLALAVDRAARKASRMGIYNHGSLNPWRIVTYSDGDVALLGYALPPIEVSSWLDEETEVPPGPGFRYTPPERIEDKAEDVRTDIYTLGMIAAEMAMGRPLLEGDAETMLQLIRSDAAAGALGDLGRQVHELLEQALAHRRDLRPATGQDVADQAKGVLRALDGHTLGGLTRGAFDEDAVTVNEGMNYPPLLYDAAAAADELVLASPEEEVAVVPSTTIRPSPTMVPEEEDGWYPFEIEDDGDYETVDDDDFADRDIDLDEGLDIEAPPAEDDPIDAPLEDRDDDLGAAFDLAPPAEPKIDLRARSLVVPDPGADSPPLHQRHRLASVAADLAGILAAEAGVAADPRETVGVHPALVPSTVRVDDDTPAVVPEDPANDEASAPAPVPTPVPAEVLPPEDGEGGIHDPESIGHKVVGLAAKPAPLPSWAPEEEPPPVSPLFAPRPQPLPDPARTLYCRDGELEAALDALTVEALVTVAGPPGSGASELALLAARALQGDGWEVHACNLDAGQNVAETLARGLGLSVEGKDEARILVEVGNVLAERKELLFFLDAPHDHPDLRGIVAGFLAQWPVGVILVACRGPLGLTGEHVIQLEALPSELATALFVDLAGKVRPGAEVDPQIARAITDHLDRMPVAIDAAASKTAFLEPQAILELLESGRDLEWGEDGLDAHLAATLDRLDPVERRALEQFGVFEDGFGLKAAEDVVLLADPRRSMINVIESLKARSLLKVVSGGDSADVRWSLYETMRSHLRRTLDIATMEDARQRHAKVFGLFGIRLGGRPWVERPERALLLRERANLRSALQMGGAPAAGAALGLTAILGPEPAAPLAQAIDRILAEATPVDPDAPSDQGLLPLGDKDPSWHACAQLASARLHLHLGQPQKSRSALRAASDEIGPTDTELLIEVAWLHTELGSTFGAEAALHQVITNEPWERGVIALLRGRALVAKASAPKAQRAFVEALHGFGSLNADVGCAHVQRHLADVLAAKGQGRRAVELLDQARIVFEETDDPLNAIHCRMRQAELLVGIGHGEEAVVHLQGVLTQAQEVAAHGLVALARGVLGVVHTIALDWDDAEREFFLALAGSAPDQKRIQALFALNLWLRGDAETAHEEAQGALPNPVARALVAALERQAAPHDNDEAFLLFEVMEAWRASASTQRFEDELQDRPVAAVRMVLACPPRRSRTAAS